MMWRPRVVYDAGAGEVTLDFSLPQRPWAFAFQVVGGSRRSASGAVASYRVRHDELVEKSIRFTEGEWPNVRAWLIWAQEGGAFAWWDDQDDVSTADTVTLFAPTMGESLRPARDNADLSVFGLTLTLREE